MAFKNHSRFIPFGQLCPYNLHSVTHKVKKNEETGNSLLDSNKSLYRIQSYSPNLRAPQGSKHGTGGIQTVAEGLLDIRSLCAGSSYLRLDTAHSKVKNFLELARKHTQLLRTRCGMARLELTFKSISLTDDEVFDNGVRTLMHAFRDNIKIYSSDLVADLADISLLAFEGISSAVLLSMAPNLSEVQPSWDEFADVWSCLTYVAINFFSGKRSYDTRTTYAPRLGYTFSRPLYKSSWVGVNSALSLTCGTEKILDRYTNIWYSHNYTDSAALRTEMKNKFMTLDNSINTKLGESLIILIMRFLAKLRRKSKLNQS